MRSIVPLIAFVRGQQLERQFRRIGKSLEALPATARARLSLLTLREIGQAARGEFPHLYGTPPQDRYLPWGRGTAVGFTRACSDNPEVALRGIALWLAVAYHETKDSPYAFVRSPSAVVARGAGAEGHARQRRPRTRGRGGELDAVQRSSVSKMVS